MSDPPQLHAYTYGKLNPTVYVDPDGRQEFLGDLAVQGMFFDEEQQAVQRELDRGVAEGLFFDSVPTFLQNLKDLPKSIPAASKFLNDAFFYYSNNPGELIPDVMGALNDAGEALGEVPDSQARELGRKVGAEFGAAGLELVTGEAVLRGASALRATRGLPDFELVEEAAGAPGGEAARGPGAPEVNLVEPRPSTAPGARRGHVSSDPGVLKRKMKAARAGDRSAEAELRVAKQLREEGKDVHFNAENPGAKTADLRVARPEGSLDRPTDVKRATGIGGNLASNLAKGVRQVGEGGQVILVRGAESKQPLSVFEDFAGSFIPSEPGVTIRVIDEATLPEL